MKKFLKKIALLSVVIIIIIACISFYKICYKNYYLTVTGIVEYADGIGRQIIDLEDLIGDEVEMNTTAIVNTKQYLPERFKEIIKIKNKKPGYVVLNEYSLSFGFQEDKRMQQILFDADKNRLRKSFNRIPREEQIFISYSMFESDRIPQHWVYRINSEWDMVVVPDQSLVDVYINSGVKKPIFVVPLGTNLETHLNAPLKKEAGKIFTFANFSAIEERKNLMKLLEAYHKTFNGNDKVRLLLSSRRDGGSYKELKEYILKNNVQGVEIDIGTKDSRFYNFAFENIDCYVSPSKGEGFSVIPREAMARGIPTIVSDALAQKTIANTGLVKVVPANKLVPGYYSHADKFIGNYYDIEVNDLAEAMLEVYKNYQKFLDNAPAARSWAEKGQYKYLKEEYINMVKPKKIILGDKNEITKDYLMTNSKELYNKWKHLKDKGLL